MEWKCLFHILMKLWAIGRLLALPDPYEYVMFDLLNAAFDCQASHANDISSFFPSRV